MKHFEIPPLGITADDLQAVGAAIDDFMRRDKNFVLHYWSKERRILLVVQHEMGQVVDWMLMPCATQESVPELLNRWLEQVAPEGWEREQTALSKAIAEVGRVRAKRH